MKQKFKKFKILIVAAILYLIVFIINKEIFFSALTVTKGFLKEMIQVLPPVLVISALITVWVPSETIKKGLGHKSGIKGVILSFFIGSVSAGPIYAAFPAALVLFKKGASITNMVIILSSWAVVKLPMLFVETSFLGLRFTLTRLALTIPAILIIGTFVGKTVKRDEIVEDTSHAPKSPKDILFSLPAMNCGACGYADCKLFANAVFDGEKEIIDCVVLERQKRKKDEKKK